MKMTVSDFELHLLGFAKRLVRVPKEGLNRFAAGAAIISKINALESQLQAFADADGMIDTELVRKAVNGGFEASDGEIKILVGHPMLKLLGANPELITLKQEDADQFFASL